MNDWYAVSGGLSSVVGIALHSGDMVSPETASFLAITPKDRRLEEDLFTQCLLPSVCRPRVEVYRSRFEGDLNRLPEHAVYLRPENAWGLKVWKTYPPAGTLAALRQDHQAFYRQLFRILSDIQSQFGPRFVVISPHSYLQARADKDKSPDVDVCTWLAQPHWQDTIGRFVACLQESDTFAQPLTIGQNTRFEAYYLERWLAEHFPECCCFAIEVAKELFMETNLLGFVPKRLAAIATMIDCATSTIQL